MSPSNVIDILHRARWIHTIEGFPDHLPLVPELIQSDLRNHLGRFTRAHEGANFVQGAYSAKLFTGTRHRFSGFSQPRQCGDDMFLMLVTGGPPNFGGGGMPQRIMVSSRSSPALRITGAG